MGRLVFGASCLSFTASARSHSLSILILHTLRSAKSKETLFSPHCAIGPAGNYARITFHKTAFTSLQMSPSLKSNGRETTLIPILKKNGTFLYIDECL